MKVSVFAALSSEIRLALIKELLKNKAQCICSLSSKMNRDISTVSRHITSLKNANLVVTERKGKEVRVSLKAPKATKKILEIVKKEIEQAQSMKKGCFGDN